MVQRDCARGPDLRQIWASMSLPTAYSRPGSGSAPQHFRACLALLCELMRVMEPAYIIEAWLSSHTIDVNLVMKKSCKK
jgi:hypothetical protein